MPSFRSGVVTAILHERSGLQRVEVDGEKAYVLTQLIGSVAVGDRVVINTTAVELGLGTGGWHVVHWNLARDRWQSEVAGREMKLRYTSLQVEVSIPAGGHLPDVPTVGCTLHSQVAAVALAYKRCRPQGRLVYVMPDGGALPIAFSDLVHVLRADGYLHATVTAGHAFGGDGEATTLDHALVVAGEFAPDAIVVAIGPGSLGVGSGAGFSGRDVVRALEVATDPILSVRYSDADPRLRHAGVSHHAAAVLDAVEQRVVRVPIPVGEPAPEVGRHKVVAVEVPDLIPDLTALGVTSMGRLPSEDPRFWAYAGAAGVVAAGTSR